MTIVVLAAALPFAEAEPVAAATLERVREAGRITLGYRADARPFSYRDESGKAAGYSVALCQMITDQIKVELALPALAVEWVPITVEDRFVAVEQGKADLLCGPDTATLTRRKQVSFSIPIFPGGIGALLRTDSSPALQQVLSQAQPPSRPIWRGSPARTILESKTFSVVAGTTSQSWLASRLNTFELTANVVPVVSYEAGVRRVLDRGSDVFFGDRPILLDAAKRASSTRDLTVLDRQFTYELLALALARNDDDFRLFVDRKLSRVFGSAQFYDLYTRWFGQFDKGTINFFRLVSLPE